MKCLEDKNMVNNNMKGNERRNQCLIIKNKTLFVQDLKSAVHIPFTRFSHQDESM